LPSDLKGWVFQHLRGSLNIPDNRRGSGPNLLLFSQETMLPASIVVGPHDISATVDLEGECGVTVRDVNPRECAIIAY
jgi:hypothetical protein